MFKRRAKCIARRLFLCFFMFVVLRCNLMTSLVLHAKIMLHATNIPQIADLFRFQKKKTLEALNFQGILRNNYGVDTI